MKTEELRKAVERMLQLDRDDLVVTFDPKNEFGDSPTNEPQLSDEKIEWLFRAFQSLVEAAERRRTEEVIEEVESLHYIKKVDRDCVTSALRSKFLKNPER